MNSSKLVISGSPNAGIPTNVLYEHSSRVHLSYSYHPVDVYVGLLAGTVSRICSNAGSSSTFGLRHTVHMNSRVPGIPHSGSKVTRPESHL